MEPVRSTTSRSKTLTSATSSLSCRRTCPKWVGRRRRSARIRTPSTSGWETGGPWHRVSRSYGASIYDVSALSTEGGGEGEKIPQLCGQTVHKIRTKGEGGQKIPNFCGRHIWKPPYKSGWIHWMRAIRYPSQISLNVRTQWPRDIIHIFS